MATDVFFKITDGTTSCIFADGNYPPGATNYTIPVDSWAPAVAGLLVSQLGGRGPYADVVETIPVEIKGSDTPTLLANVQTLERLIQQAERWARGENVAPVLVQYSPRGATASTAAAPLQAVILGRDPSAIRANTPSAVALPATFNRVAPRLVVANATLTFLRRGAWLLSTPVSGTSASIANPGPYPITGMTTHPNPSPCKVTIAGFPVAAGCDFADSSPIVLLAQQATDLQLVSAVTGGLPANYSSVNDAAHNAYSTNVLRYTPPDLVEYLSNEISVSSITSNARRFAFFAAIRNNSATTTFSIRVGALVQFNTVGPLNVIAAYTRPVTIDAAHTRPRFVPLGIVSTPLGLKSIQLAIKASAASGTIDINYIVALAVDNPYAKAIQLVKSEGSGDRADGNNVVNDIVIDPHPLTNIAPSIWRAYETTSDIEPLGYLGDAYTIASGTTFQSAIMCKEQYYGYNTSWTYVTAAGVANFTATCARQNAYLTPE